MSSEEDATTQNVIVALNRHHRATEQTQGWWRAAETLVEVPWQDNSVPEAEQPQGLSSCQSVLFNQFFLFYQSGS